MSNRGGSFPPRKSSWTQLGACARHIGNGISLIPSWYLPKWPTSVVASWRPSDHGLWSMAGFRHGKKPMVFRSGIDGGLSPRFTPWYWSVKIMAPNLKTSKNFVGELRHLLSPQCSLFGYNDCIWLWKYIDWNVDCSSSSVQFNWSCFLCHVRYMCGVCFWDDMIVFDEMTWLHYDWYHSTALHWIWFIMILMVIYSETWSLSR